MIDAYWKDVAEITPTAGGWTTTATYVPVVRIDHPVPARPHPYLWALSAAMIAAGAALVAAGVLL